MEAQWPHGVYKCARLWIEWSRFELWLAGHCVLFLGKTLYSYPGVEMGTCKLNAGGLASNPKGNRNTPSHFMLQKPGKALACWATIGSYADLCLPLPLCVSVTHKICSITGFVFLWHQSS